MIKVRFNNEKVFRDAEFDIVSGKIVQLVGNIEANTSGFGIYHNNMLIGDYSKYTTIYKQVDGGYQFSRDGSSTIKPVEEPMTFAKMQEKMINLEAENELLRDEIMDLTEYQADILFELSLLELGITEESEVE